MNFNWNFRDKDYFVLSALFDFVNVCDYVLCVRSCHHEVQNNRSGSLSAFEIEL